MFHKNKTNDINKYIISPYLTPNRERSLSKQLMRRKSKDIVATTLEKKKTFNRNKRFELPSSNTQQLINKKQQLNRNNKYYLNSTIKQVKEERHTSYRSIPHGKKTQKQFRTKIKSGHSFVIPKEKLEDDWVCKQLIMNEVYGVQQDDQF